MDSENENQLQRIRKTTLLLSQEESLGEKGKKHPCLFDKSQKTYKERDVLFKSFPYPKALLFFSQFDYLIFEVLKIEIT